MDKPEFAVTAARTLEDIRRERGFRLTADLAKALGIDTSSSVWKHFKSGDSIPEGPNRRLYAVFYLYSGRTEFDPRTLPPKVQYVFGKGQRVINRAWREKEWQEWLRSNDAKSIMNKMREGGILFSAVIQKELDALGLNGRTYPVQGGVPSPSSHASHSSSQASANILKRMMAAKEKEWAEDNATKLLYWLDANGYEEDHDRLARELKIALEHWTAIKEASGFIELLGDELSYPYFLLWERTGLFDPCTLPPREIRGAELTRAWNQDMIARSQAKRAMALQPVNHQGGATTANTSPAKRPTSQPAEGHIWESLLAKAIRLYCDQNGYSPYSKLRDLLGLTDPAWRTLFYGAAVINDTKIYARLYAWTGLGDPRTLPPRIYYNHGNPYKTEVRAWTEEQWQEWLQSDEAKDLLLRMKAEGRTSPVIIEGTYEVVSPATPVAGGLPVTPIQEEGHSAQLPPSDTATAEFFGFATEEAGDLAGNGQQDEAVKTAPTSEPTMAEKPSGQLTIDGIIRQIVNQEVDQELASLAESIGNVVQQSVEQIAQALLDKTTQQTEGAQKLESMLQKQLELLERIATSLQNGNNGQQAQRPSDIGQQAAALIRNLTTHYIQGSEVDRQRLADTHGAILGELLRLTHTLTRSPSEREEQVRLNYRRSQ